MDPDKPKKVSPEEMKNRLRRRLENRASDLRAYLDTEGDWSADDVKDFQGDVINDRRGSLDQIIAEARDGGVAIDEATETEIRGLERSCMQAYSRGRVLAHIDGLKKELSFDAVDTDLLGSYIGELNRADLINEAGQVGADIKDISDEYTGLLEQARKALEAQKLKEEKEGSRPPTDEEIQKRAERAVKGPAVEVNLTIRQFEDMARGGNPEGIRDEFYPAWENKHFVQLLEKIVELQNQ